MAKGKSQFITWYCQNPLIKEEIPGGREKPCNQANKVSYYNPRNREEYVTETSRFCPKCRMHAPHKRKDTKKGSS